MDCLKAQSLISETLDGVITDPTEIREAKQHCRECADCGAFVRTLLALDRGSLPEPASDLPERIMVTVRAEAQRAARARMRAVAGPAQVTSRAGQVPPQSPARPSVQQSLASLIAFAKDARNRKAVVTWGAVAAALAVFVGWGAVAGVRQMLIPRPAVRVSLDEESGGAQLQIGTPAPTGATTGSTLAGGTDTSAWTAKATENFITVGSTVYRLIAAAPADTDLSQLTSTGSVRSKFDGAGAAQDHRAYQSPVPGHVYVENGDSTYDFERVYLTYQGRLYLLSSGPIDSFGEWPVWPGTVAKPTTASGLPSLKEAGTTENNTPVFVPVSGSSGIALPPTPAGPSAVAGAPDWTWWQLADK